MRKVHHIAHTICPAITVLFSLFIGFVTMYIENTISPLFVFLSIQFYLNWYLICNINKSVVIPFSMISCEGLQNLETGSRYCWYCDKCKQYTRRSTQHCPFCHKCYYYRDHHCFFLGSCILRQNMGNFILACLYASLACIYSVSVVGSYLYEYFVQMGTAKFNVYYFALNFFFPITLLQFIFHGTDQIISMLLVTVFNISISIGCLSSFYAVWKLYACLSGKQKYVNDTKHQDLIEVFGSYGVVNFIFPFDGFLHSNRLDEKCELKTV
ncbi:palmitoyltransferase ZDHHC22-like [Copidosoma floridanum]|uniref:palmitoyltransferase ZDHHC22-like n=1 Tax=Copidosoma floridanum TaxID=29053 RepID=UPI0006C98D44|nr:palmitoyltransferase ZDHHC22-like [Copidosoma floridanum]